MVVCGQWEGVFPLCLSLDRGQHEVGVGPQDLPPVSFVTPPIASWNQELWFEALPRARGTEGGGSCEDYVGHGQFIQ